MKRRLTLMLVAGLFAGLVSTVSAQTGEGYNLTWNMVDGGGATFSAGGTYALQGGFWSPPGYLAYVPIVRRP